MAWSAPALAAGDWHFRATSYVFMSDIDGKQTIPAAEDVHVDFADLLKKTDFSFMGGLEARRKRIGAFIDVIYIDLGDEKDGTTHVETGAADGIPLPPGITADLKLDVKSWIVTTAAYYRLHDAPRANLDVFAGTRMTRTKTTLDYAFSAPFGPFQGPLQQGSIGDKVTDWDGIAGAKGRVSFGKRLEWSLFGYADVGAGASKLTYQLFAGGGRRFGAVDLIAGWRRVTFEYGSGPIEELTYSGPLLGASLSF